jgi:Coenzyme PQQ synthesis protein D (PqqD)
VVRSDRSSIAGSAGELNYPALKEFGAQMDASLSVHSIVVAAGEQVSCPLGEESAILNLKNSVYYGINPVGTRVWSLLKQPRSVEELRDTLLNEYEVDAELCERDLLNLLEKMRSEGLIEVRGAATT